MTLPTPAVAMIDNQSEHKYDEAEPYIARILESSDSSGMILEILVELDTQDSLAVYVFEAVSARAIRIPYWAYYRVSQAYFRLGRDDACFLTASSAMQMEPSYPNWHMFENTYRYLTSRRRFAEAVEVARHQIRHTPEIPIISPNALYATMRQAGMVTDQSFEPTAHRKRHDLYPAETFRMKPFDRYGIKGADSQCFALEQFSNEIVRHEVTVWELDCAEIIIYGRNILIFDENKVLQSDISVCEFPDVLAQKVLEPEFYSSLKVQEVDTVVIISDKYGTANVCHFLLDQITRLALYEKLCDIENCFVVGPSLVAKYQENIVENLKIPIAQYKGTDESHLIRASRLLISETCKKTFTHPAHLAASWAFDFLNKKFTFQSSNLTPPRRIYISRADASIRFIHNEPEVIRKLEVHGFSRIVLSDFPYDEQAALFANATHIVGMHGAGMTNIVFCPVGSHILEIFHPIGCTAAYAVVATNLDIIYSAMVAQDALSSEDIYNDWTVASRVFGMGGAQALTNRDVIVDIDELDRWLSESGANS